MPRVFTQTARASKKKRACNECGQPIEPGQVYLSWSFHRSPPTLRHQACGYPRPSELTRSKVSGLYAAREDVEDVLAKWDGVNVDEVADALRNCATEAEGVKDEYEESIENMPENFQEGQTAEDMREKMDSIETWMQELEDAADEIESMVADKAGDQGEDADDKPASDQAEDEAEDEEEEGLREQVEVRAQEALDALEL